MKKLIMKCEFAKHFVSVRVMKSVTCSERFLSIVRSGSVQNSLAIKYIHLFPLENGQIRIKSDGSYVAHNKRMFY